MKEKIFVTPGNSSGQIFDNLFNSRNELFEFLKNLGESNNAFLSIVVTQPIFKSSFEPKKHISRVGMPTIGTVERFREELNASVLNGFPKFWILIEFNGPNNKVFSEKSSTILYKFYIETEEEVLKKKNVLELDSNDFVLSGIDDATFQKLKTLIEKVAEDVAAMIFRVAQVQIERNTEWEKVFIGQG